MHAVEFGCTPYEANIPYREQNPVIAVADINLEMLGNALEYTKLSFRVNNKIVVIHCNEAKATVENVKLYFSSFLQVPVERLVLISSGISFNNNELLSAYGVHPALPINVIVLPDGEVHVDDERGAKEKLQQRDKEFYLFPQGFNI